VGFLQPNLPVVDHEVWDHLPRQERIVPMTRHFALHGFGSPDVVILSYIVKIGIYLAVGWAFVMSTPGIDGAFDVGAWWSNPAVFFKFAFWTMLFEVLGLGCGFGPLNLRFIPPLGSFLYWLRPGTIRLPPWPRRNPIAGGDTRTPFDVALYAGLLVALVVTLVGAIPRWEVLTVVVLLGFIGLRDQTVFLAARGEVYESIALAALFSAGDQVTAAKFVMVIIWFGAAVSKLNRHFPFVVAAMMANSPVLRSTRLKAHLWRDAPDDLRPGRPAAVLAHTGTVVELVAPMVLLLSGGGWVTTVAALVMIGFHLTILTSFPMGVPLEWNVFMIIGIVVLFLGNPGLDLGALSRPVALAALVLGLLAVVVYGNLVPERVSFLPSMRYYAGNWAATMWCFRGDALERFERNVTTATLLPHQQLEKVYGSAEEAAVPLHMGYAFRGFHTHGRALWTLVAEACGPDHEDYLVLDGELVAGTALGWNFGDGHLHDEQLIEALQRRCDFAPGDVRIVFLESQPFHRGTQQYRLIDAATGPIGRGHVVVTDMVARQPTDADLPLHRDPGTEP